ncbi:hypothetical protein PHSY_003312 [Pseudozyma hubeiensis SY62]|uniref:Zinc-finger domain-containing protein n=1 Tax=Pseudozyma hubeiensis (strain SY62) TaxID=1305764 RepID=R9P316_PSEHS|nr:hypothetical protein PHSY_003312 [Pseudozyma hubeiensis SY62]GAC95736.1 hypothetical protein PHSY_003312 [Pseudozyma hubeiensis SY62]
MAAPPKPSVFVDLTGGGGDDDDGDDSLSELSDAPDLSTSSSSKPKSKGAALSSSKSSVNSALKRSASSSNVAKPSSNGSTKPKARKSEPTPPSTSNAQQESAKAKGKRKQDGADVADPKQAQSRSAPLSDVVRSRTHVNDPDGPLKLCHQHHQNCKGALLECTFMRAPGKRCQGRFCFSSLKRFYDQDPETIVKSNRMMINPAEHCPPTETKYAWKCPKCRGKCVCSVCRKAAGLEPLGRPFGSKKPKDPPTDDAGQAKSTQTKVKPNGDTPKPTSTATAKAKSKPKDRTLAEAVAASHKQDGKAKSKAKSANATEVVEDDDISTPPPPGSKPKKTVASLLSTSVVRAPVLKPLKPPAQVAPPVFELIPTKLPHDNMRARMWIYESMIRFDKFGLNRTVLSQLDRFEHWTHLMAQDMLACLLKTVAGMSNIEKGQPNKPFVRAITSFRTHGKSLQRGEPWSAAVELLHILGLERAPLAFVEHDVPVEVEAAAAERSPSPPPATRLTRARRAKETNQYETARQLSLLDSWEEDEFGDVEDAEVLPSKRRRATTKKSIYVYDDPSDDESMDDPDDTSRSRRSGRARKAAEKESAPEVRLTGRQQAIKLQQEQQKEEEAAAEKHKQEEDQGKRQAEAAARKRRASNGDGASSDGGTVSEASDDEHRQTNGRAHKKRRRLVAGESSDDEATSDNDNDVHHKRDGNDIDADDKQDTRAEDEDKPTEAPDLETKVSILSALIDAAVMADSVAEELKLAADNIAAMDREHRAANLDMEKEMVDELAELNRRAPSIVSPEYQKWKAEKAQLEQDHAWRRQDARVTSELAVDTHALRTGPLGVDVDGREYWHLREYQERMPKYTEGRYAWCLVVMGPAFPSDPNRKKEEAKEEDQGDTSKGDAAGDDGVGEDGDDSGLTSLDASTTTTGDDTKPELPDTTDEKHLNLGLPPSSICMGANDPSTIKTLIDYLRFRLEHVEYQENVSIQQRERAARGDHPSEAAAESMYSIRKAKQTLKDTQDERRKQVEQLIKRLGSSKEYFAWHREEVAP